MPSAPSYVPNFLLFPMEGHAFALMENILQEKYSYPRDNLLRTGLGRVSDRL